MSDPHAALHALFGFPAFRPGQEEAVRAALAGRDALVVMPTGAGKGLCHQLPALMRDEVTVVVSPLVSLMQDQAEALARRAPGRVAMVSGLQTAGENEAAVAAAVRGAVRVLHVAPERFSTPGFARALRAARVGLFVVDEAHCVSQWGHDFRPDYLRLADAARRLGARSILASTATATPRVAADVVARLGLRDPVRIATGFDRPNLSWAVVPSTPQARAPQLAALLAEPGATPAIVYAGTRRQVDALAEALQAALARPVVAYHAGLGRAERAAAQRRFMAGEVGVVVATNAFGMGVDKADVRTVAHATVPGSVEAYYQEAGRAGRDGAPARAVLLAAPRDKGLHVHVIQRGGVTEEHVAGVARRLEAAVGGGRRPGEPPPAFDVGLEELGGAGTDRVRAALGALARADVLQLAPAPPDRARGRLLAAYDGRARALCRAGAAGVQRERWRQHRAIWGLVEGARCRRATVLEHFGDAAPAPRPAAGCCDVCDPAVVPEALRGPRRGGGEIADLCEAVLAVALAAPGLDATGVAEVVRGVGSLRVRRARHDGLAGFGTFPHALPADVLAVVDELLASGRLRRDAAGGLTAPAGEQVAA